MIEFEVGTTYKTLSPLNIRLGPSTAAGYKPYNQLTEDGKKHATGSTLNKGTNVTALEIRITPHANELWIRIPSGWICGVYKNEIYVERLN